MNPLATTALPDASRATPAPNFAGASPNAAGVPFTSGIKPTTTIIPVTVAQGGGYAAIPTAALMGAVGAAAVLANM
jgi:hypothetical protein